MDSDTPWWQILEAAAGIEAGAVSGSAGLYVPGAVENIAGAQGGDAFLSKVSALTNTLGVNIAGLAVAFILFGIGMVMFLGIDELTDAIKSTAVTAAEV